MIFYFFRQLGLYFDSDLDMEAAPGGPDSAILESSGQLIFLQECCHSSVDLSAPSILLPRVRVPSILSMLLSIYIWFLSCKKDENKQKRPEWAHLKKIAYKYLVNFWQFWKPSHFKKKNSCGYFLDIFRKKLAYFLVQHLVTLLEGREVQYYLIICWTEVGLFFTRN